MRLCAAAVVVGLLLWVAGPVSAQFEDEQTTVERLTVEERGGAVDVSGVAAFGSVSGAIGTDTAGDALVPVVGADLTEAAITARRTAEGDVLTFRLAVADQPEEINGVPETVEYLWYMRVVGWRGTSTYLCLRAFRSSQVARPGDPGPTFLLHEGISCTSWPANDAMFLREGRDVAGSMAEGVVEFDVPANLVDTRPDEVNPTEIRWTNNIAARLLHPNPPLTPRHDLDAVEGEGPAFVMPEAEVKAGIAPVGTPVEAVPLSVDTTPEPDGSFAMTLPTAGEPPGDYAIVVRACYGDNCGIGTDTITIL